MNFKTRYLEIQCFKSCLIHSPRACKKNQDSSYHVCTLCILGSFCLFTLCSLLNFNNNILISNLQFLRIPLQNITKTNFFTHINFPQILLFQIISLGPLHRTESFHPQRKTPANQMTSFITSTKLESFLHSHRLTKQISLIRSQNSLFLLQPLSHFHLIFSFARALTLFLRKLTEHLKFPPPPRKRQQISTAFFSEQEENVTGRSARASVSVPKLSPCVRVRGALKFSHFMILCTFPDFDSSRWKIDENLVDFEPFRTITKSQQPLILNSPELT